MEKTKTKQIESVIVGVAVGDALGVPFEFKQRGTFHATDMIGYGTHHQPVGTWSDDTSLTLCLADAMANDWTVAGIVKETADNLLRWFDEGAFTAHGNVFDIGISTHKAIRNLKDEANPENAGCSGESENGNGGLMRIAPLVFYTADKPEPTRFNITKTVSAITHAHAWSVAACFIYMEYLRKLLWGQDKNAAYTELQNDFRDGSPYVDSGTLSKFARVLRDDIRALPESAIKSGGFVIDTLEAALWCFLTTDNYRYAVLEAVNLGEDTDTTAAVTGGIAGLYYGVDAIPENWVGSLARLNDIKDLCLKMAGVIAETKQA